MELDHSKATATIWISGLALFCINEKKNNQCEFGFLKCDDRHRLTFDIQEIHRAAEGIPVWSKRIQHSLNLSQDISIKVLSPVTRGVTPFAPTLRFNRLNEVGDAKDFRWIADLDGLEFHNTNLEIKNRAKLNPILVISDGSLYTRRRTDEKFARMSVEANPSHVPLGKVGYQVGVDINCEDDGSIVLRNLPESDPARPSASNELILKKEPDLRYLITFDNHCTSRLDFDGSDFQLFYDVLRVPGNRFDLRRIVENEFGGVALSLNQMNYSLDGFPEICTPAFTSGPIADPEDTSSGR